jgi:hypothetical protein
MARGVSLPRNPYRLIVGGSLIGAVFAARAYNRAMRANLRLFVPALALAGTALAGCGATERGIATAKPPMPAIWAFLLLIVGAAVAVAAMYIFAGAMCYLLIGPFILLGDLEQRLKCFSTNITPFVVAALSALCGSFAGTALAGSARLLAWPRTQIDPLFVFLVLALTTLSPLYGCRKEVRNDVFGGAIVFLLCFATVGCFGAYIWAAVFDSTLVGPWRWCYGLFGG